MKILILKIVFLLGVIVGICLSTVKNGINVKTNNYNQCGDKAKEDMIS